MHKPNVSILPARTTEEIEAVRQLFINYAAYLAANPSGAANICIEKFEHELASLPGPYASPGGVLLLAHVDGAAAGCCALRPLHAASHNASDEAAVELKRLWVEPVARGLRLGRQLIEAAIDHAVSIRCTAIYLDTVPDAMPEASRLYASLGFKPTPRYNRNPVPGVAFLRKLLH